MFSMIRSGRALWQRFPLRCRNAIASTPSRTRLTRQRTCPRSRTCHRRLGIDEVVLDQRISMPCRRSICQIGCVRHREVGSALAVAINTAALRAGVLRQVVNWTVLRARRPCRSGGKHVPRRHAQYGKQPQKLEKLMATAAHFLGRLSASDSAMGQLVKMFQPRAIPSCLATVDYIFCRLLMGTREVFARFTLSGAPLRVKRTRRFCHEGATIQPVFAGTYGDPHGLPRPAWFLGESSAWAQYGGGGGGGRGSRQKSSSNSDSNAKNDYRPLPAPAALSPHAGDYVSTRRITSKSSTCRFRPAYIFTTEIKADDRQGTGGATMTLQFPLEPAGEDYLSVCAQAGRGRQSRILWPRGWISGRCKTRR